MKNIKEEDLKFKKEQMIWVLSDLANINAGAFEPDENSLKANAMRLKSAVTEPGVISDFLNKQFSVVWGPVLCNAPVSFKEKEKEGLDKGGKAIEVEVSGFTTTNLLYVTKGVDPVDNKTPLYVVATAGTNPVSQYGWFDEDFMVGSVKAWPPEFVTLEKPVNAGAISAGSYDGLKKLWGMVDSEKRTLFDFLSGILNGKDKAEIATCGHSLGGALSPLLALSLIENQEESSKALVKVSAYPTAGPSSGNSVFADYATKKFAGNYFSRVNRYDIVPHAWQENNDQQMDMSHLTTLYSSFNCLDGKGIPDGAVIDGFICWAKFQRNSNDYKRIGQDTIFEGQPIPLESKTTLPLAKEILKNAAINAAFRTMVIKCGRPSDQLHIPLLLSDFLAYALEAGGQHTTVYGSQGLNLPQNLLNELSNYVDLKDLNLDSKEEAKRLVEKLVGEVLTHFVSHDCKGCK